jgi:hypothetical protein
MVRFFAAYENKPVLDGLQEFLLMLRARLRARPPVLGLAVVSGCR